MLLLSKEYEEVNKRLRPLCLGVTNIRHSSVDNINILTVIDKTSGDIKTTKITPWDLKIAGDVTSLIVHKIIDVFSGDALGPYVEYTKAVKIRMRRKIRV